MFTIYKLQPLNKNKNHKSVFWVSRTMKSSHTAIICIVMFSLFALNECTYRLFSYITIHKFLFSSWKFYLYASNRCVGGRIEVKGIVEAPISKIYLPKCAKSPCGSSLFKKNCWCCSDITKNKCWLIKEFPNAEEICLANC